MKRIMIIAVGAILVGLVVAASLALSPGTQSTSSDDTTQTSDLISSTTVVDLDQIREDAVRSLFDSNGKLINLKQQLAGIAEDNEGGFGGYYFHETDKSIVYVYMKDVTKTAAAEAAFMAAYDGDHQVSQIVPVEGNYSFDQLVEWFGILDKTMIESGIPPARASIREIENSIHIGLRDGGQIDDVRGIMERLGIPEGAVVVEEDYMRLLTDKDSVRGKWRPLVGGIQHETGWYTNTCTIGFVTERDNVAGLVVASHCTNIYEDIGGVDNADIHQPNDPLVGDNIVAEETIDPALSNIDHEQCPTGWICRYSDAAFAELDGDKSIDLGEIAKPIGLNETDVDPAGTTFEITSDSSSVGIGDVVYYIGRTGGWHTAEVISTCDYAIFPPNVRIICTATARVTGSSDDPAGGDSGAPVFKPGPGNSVKLVGTLFAGSEINTDEFSFSPLGNIYMELGLSSTWDSCVSGC